MTRQWFEVDTAGLAKLIADKGKVFLLHELVSNAWDTDSTRIEVTLEKVSGARLARLIVKDDHPEGFQSLEHAYTLFAESEKKGAAVKANLPAVVDLIVHELGHHYESSHLSERYHRAITMMAGKLAVLALTKPVVFK